MVKGVNDHSATRWPGRRTHEGHCHLDSFVAASFRHGREERSLADCPQPTCPNCGGVEFDEDGDCTSCWEPGVVEVAERPRTAKTNRALIAKVGGKYEQDVHDRTVHRADHSDGTVGLLLVAARARWASRLVILPSVFGTWKALCNEPSWSLSSRNGSARLAAKARCRSSESALTPDDDRPELGELLKGVPESARLLGADRRTVHRVEVEHDHDLTPVVRQSDLLAVVGLGDEVGCGITWAKWRHDSVFYPGQGSSSPRTMPAVRAEGPNHPRHDETLPESPGLDPGRFSTSRGDGQKQA